MAPHRVGDVTDSRHVSVELRHRTILFDLLRKGTFRAESLVGSHYKKARPNRRNSNQIAVRWRLSICLIYIKHIKNHLIYCGIRPRLVNGLVEMLL